MLQFKPKEAQVVAILAVPWKIVGFFKHFEARLDWLEDLGYRASTCITTDIKNSTDHLMKIDSADVDLAWIVRHGLCLCASGSASVGATTLPTPSRSHRRKSRSRKSHAKRSEKRSEKRSHRHRKARTWKQLCHYCFCVLEKKGV